MRKWSTNVLHLIQLLVVRRSLQLIPHLVIFAWTSLLQLFLGQCPRLNVNYNPQNPTTSPNMRIQYGCSSHHQQWTITVYHHCAAQPTRTKLRVYLALGIWWVKLLLIIHESLKSEDDHTVPVKPSSAVTEHREISTAHTFHPERANHSSKLLPTAAAAAAQPSRQGNDNIHKRPQKPKSLIKLKLLKPFMSMHEPDRDFTGCVCVSTGVDTEL